MSLEEDLESLSVAGRAGTERRQYTGKMLSDSLGYVSGILGKMPLPQKAKEFLSYVGAHLISVEPDAGARTQQVISCKAIDREFFTDILELKGIGALAGQVNDKTVSPKKLKSIFPELEELEGCCFKEELINKPYSHIFAAEPAYRPVLTALFREMPDKAIVQPGKFNKSQVTLSTKHLVETLQANGLNLDMVESINSEIKRINGLYESAEEKRRSSKAKVRKSKELSPRVKDILGLKDYEMPDFLKNKYELTDDPVTNYLRRYKGLKL